MLDEAVKAFVMSHEGFVTDFEYDMRFRGEITYKDKPERMLHAYIWFNRKRLFGDDVRIVLHERPVDRRMMSDISEGDFIFLTGEGHLLLIEAKWIPHDANGNGAYEQNKGTLRSRRTSMRKKVVKQIEDHIGLLTGSGEDGWGIDISQVNCTIFSNDGYIEMRQDYMEAGCDHRLVPDEELEACRQMIMGEFRSDP